MSDTIHPSPIILVYESVFAKFYVDYWFYYICMCIRPTHLRSSINSFLYTKTFLKITNRYRIQHKIIIPNTKYETVNSYWFYKNAYNMAYKYVFVTQRTNTNISFIRIIFLKDCFVAMTCFCLSVSDDKLNVSLIIA